MEVLNKFYSSVSSTVQQLSGVLPGNPVTREYEATQFIATAGPGMLWKIYKGYKKSTKQDAAIFVFEKKQLDKWTKTDRDNMVEILKHGINQLTKLRHPQILTVQHGLEESRESLAFATEPVFTSLANILGNTENISMTPSHLSNYKLYEVEIKYGLMQLAEGLNFLHNDVKLLHRNICPEAIIINQHGAWKIFGFDFCILDQSPPGSGPFWPFIEYCRRSNPMTQLSLEYMAPEYVLTMSHSPASDIFSLGMLIYVLHSPDHQPLENVKCDFLKYRRFAHEVRNLPVARLKCVPQTLRDYVKLMLNATPELRPDLHQFLKIPYFDDVGVKTLSYLDSLFQWDNLQKSQFYKGLPQIMQKLPHRVCMYRILPCLTKEFINPPMVPFVLPNVLLIAENSSKDEYVKHILPVLKPIMVIQDPIQILLIFMQKMELLLKLTPPEEIKNDILPMLYRALESDAQQIQELCLSVLPTFASLIDYPAMKNALLPRIKRLCLTTNYLSVRVNCLLCIGKILEHLDKWLVLDEIIPFLPQITSREPAVLMGVLGIYKLALSHKKLGITKEIMATKVLPFLIPLCVENGLTLNQFNALISVVKKMITTVETEHRAKLEQLNSIQNNTKGIENTLTPKDVLVEAPSMSSEIDNMFTGLELDQFSFDKNAVTQKQEPSLSINSETTSLSIEQKQRIAQQQENARMLTQQKPLNAAPALVKETPKPVDLTSKLLQSNLHQLSNKPFPSTVSNIQPAKQVGMVLNSNHASAPIMQNTPHNFNFGHQNRPIAFQETQLNVTANQWNANTGNFNNKWANQSNPTTTKQDWSAFESLLPDSKNETENNNVKVQDSNEMMDLLS